MKVEFKPIKRMGNNDAIIITCSMLSCNGTTACLAHWTPGGNRSLQELEQ